MIEENKTIFVDPEAQETPPQEDNFPKSNPDNVSPGKKSKGGMSMGSMQNSSQHSQDQTYSRTTKKGADLTTDNTSWEKTKAKIRQAAEQEHQAAPEPQDEKDAEQKGMQLALQEQAKQNITAKAKLEELVTAAPRALIKINSVFPFELFPDQLTVEETRVNFIFHEFFSSAEYRSISIQDIMEVSVQTALFFSSIKVVSRTFNPTNTEALQINFLKTQDAKRARRIIEGLKLATQQQVDTTKLNVNDLLNKIEDLGKAQEVE